MVYAASRSAEIVTVSKVRVGPVLFIAERNEAALEPGPTGAMP